MNHKAVYRTAPATPALLNICLYQISLPDRLVSPGVWHLEVQIVNTQIFVWLQKEHLSPT